jgi:hypothetical protein
MVSKCANPACNVPFLYFHQGKLFRRENSLAHHRANGNGSKKAMRRVEFYWLCNDCADKMTVTFDEGPDILLRPRALVHRTAA